MRWLNSSQPFLRYLMIINLLLTATLASASPVSEHPERPFLTSIPALYLRPVKYAPITEALTLYPERSALIPFRDRNRLQYTYALQTDPSAPLAILIPGIGGIAFNGSALYLAELAFHSGYSVITLPSTTHWSFAVAASRSGRVGYLPDDGADLYRVLSVIKENLGRKYHLQPRRAGIIGSSYGGLDGAFLMNEDSKYKLLNLDFLIMINPPLKRASAIHKVDQYFAHGDQWTESYRQSLVSFAMGRSIEIIKGQRKIDTYERLLEAFPLEEPALAWLMANQFRKDVQNSAYVGDLIDGKSTASAAEAIKGTISEYLHDAVYQRRSLPDSRTAAAKENDSELVSALVKSGPGMLANKRLLLFHSSNDFLSFPEGTSLLGVLNLETHLYNFGGHMGLISDEQMIKDLHLSLMQLAQ